MSAAAPAAAAVTEATDQTLIYFEKQAAALCGRHALNNLLQGPYFDEFRLAEIARALDEREMSLLDDDAKAALMAQGASMNGALRCPLRRQVTSARILAGIASFAARACTCAPTRTCSRRLR